jgi:hypothetical protein
MEILNNITLDQLFVKGAMVCVLTSSTLEMKSEKLDPLVIYNHGEVLRKSD